MTEPTNGSAPDAELERFVKAPIREGRRRRIIHPVRVVLTAALVVLVGMVLAPTADELMFHFRRDVPTDIGDAVELPAGDLLPLNSRIRARVVLGNRAAEIPLWRRGSLRWGPIVVRQVLGSPIWVEYAKAAHPGWGVFVETQVEGRVVSFAPDSELADARRLIELQGAEVPPDARVVIVDERPGEMTNYVVTWVLGVALVIWSLLGLARSARLRVDGVVDDDGTV